MTEHSQNTVFHSSSFLQGQNANYVEQLHARYVADPSSVDGSWQAFFAGLGDADAEVTQNARGPSWARADWPPTPNDDLTAAMDGQWGPELVRPVGDKVRARAAEAGVTLADAQVRQAVLDSVRALMIIRAYRIRGHLVADLDPLRLAEPEPHRELDPRSYGFTEADMDRPIFIDNVLGLQVANLRTIIDILKRTHKVEVSVGAPQVAYRETITKSTSIDYTHKKQTGGTGQFARVIFEIEPNEKGKGYQFESRIVGGTVPKEYIPGVEKGLN